MMATTRKRTRRPSPPGEILAERYLEPRRISVTRFAVACGIRRKHMGAIVHGRSGLRADMAVRIAAALGTTPEYWLNLQNAIDLYDAQQRHAASGARPRLTRISHTDLGSEEQSRQLH